jgi:hypothetical protein
MEVQVTPLYFTSVGLLVAIPLNENPVAEGEAILLPVPGKVIIICPLAGIGLIVVNLIVCVAVMLTIKASPL